MARKRILIIGAGEAGQLLLNDIKKNPSLNYWVVGFIDDFKREGERVNRIEVLGRIENVPSIAKEKAVNEIIIAIPSLSKERLSQILSVCNTTGLEIKIMPATYEVVYSLKTGRPWYKDVREIDIEDLLRRRPILPDLKEMEKYVLGKTILVTGGGGSIGSEICMQIAEFNPKLLIIIEHSEFNLYNISEKLKERYKDKLELKPIIADIRNEKRIKNIFKDNKIDIVFHAAAYKHVHIMEDNIKEAITNNVFGTYNVASAAIENNVKEFVMISTDKAVNPKGIMGASKRIAEMLINSVQCDTKFVIVRFGNVIGSSGSVIPLFEKQIKKGGPITITHPEMTRYFMTIPEAAQLVIQAGAIGKPKDIMVLDMGDQYKVVDVAKELVKIHGLEPEKDIKFEYIGIRPGEKMHEELWTSEEEIGKTKNERIFLVKQKEFDKEKFKIGFDELRKILEEKEDKEIVNKIKEIIPNYVPFNSE